MSFKKRILQAIDEQGPMSKEDIYRYFKVNRHLKKEVKNLLKSMTKSGELVRTEKNKYTTLENSDLISGRIQGNERGFGFLIPDDPEIEDIYIHNTKMNTAINNDRVYVKTRPARDSGKRTEGVVVKVVERANKKIVGTFQELDDFGFVIPDEQRIYYDIYIPKNSGHGAKNGQKVVVEIEKWPTEKKNPEGKIVEILGYPEEKGVDILSIAHSQGLAIEFPQEVLREAEALPTEVTKDQLKGREDLRDLTCFTIDGEDSKDFDDAVSIEILKNRDFVLGVHIADVAEYVKEGSHIDLEAYERGNSVYLLNKVLPMLPEELSNGICSLNEGEDRLAMSIFIQVDRQGKIIGYRMSESVINSSRRLVYTDVSDFLEDGKEDYTIEGLESDLKEMEELAKLLNRRRVKRGNIDFDFKEPKIILNEDGHPVDVQVEERRVANKMIEEFMLLANETVSEEFHYREIPFLYRIHEEPDKEKLEELNALMRPFGYQLDLNRDIRPMDIQNLMNKIKGKDEEALISTMALRSMQKARYSSELVGHFGLAAKYYSHFTAPIRRYNDLVVHRIIKTVMHGDFNKRMERRYERKLPEIAEHISMTELLTQETERKVIDVKMAQYMSDRIGECYPARISGITSFGIFAQLDNTIEGLIAYETMDDFYYFDEENYMAVGKESNKRYKLGDEVEICVVGADPIQGNIDFIIVGDNNGKKESRGDAS